MVRECEGCGSQLEAGDRFCGNCGRSVLEKDEAHCPACGSPIGGTDRFCEMCGAEVGGRTAGREPGFRSRGGGGRSQKEVSPTASSAAKPTAGASVHSEKPNRFIPESIRGRLGYLILLLVLGILAADEAGFGVGLLIALGVYLILTVWRNIFIGMGAIGKRTSPEGSADQVQGGEEAGGGHWASLVGVATVIAGLVFAKAIGRFLGELLESLF